MFEEAFLALCPLAAPQPYVPLGYRANVASPSCQVGCGSGTLSGQGGGVLLSFM